MSKISAPTLSILLPTYNRAAILRLTLKHLLPEVKRLKGLVEIVIGNNASHDETDTVLMELSGDYSRVARRETNIGSWRNIVALASEARGAWIWCLGDDDYLVPNAIDLILHKLASSPAVDLMFVNHSWLSAHEIRNALAQRSAIAVPSGRQWLTSQDADLLRGTDVFNVPSPFAAGSFNAIFGFAAQRDRFLEHALRVKPGQLIDGFGDGGFELEDAFPHSIVALEIALQGPAKVVSDVCVVQGVGDWESRRLLYRTIIVGLVWLFDRFDSSIPQSAWLSLASYAGRRIARMIADPVANAGYEAVERVAIEPLARQEAFQVAFLAEVACLGLESEGRRVMTRWLAAFR